MGNFGNVMPQAQQGRVLDSGAGQVAQALSNLGQVGMQVSAKKLNEQQKIQDEKDEYYFNTQAAKYGAEYTDIVTSAKQKLTTGEFDENSAKAYLRQQSDNLSETYRQTLPETKHDRFNFYTEKMYLESEAGVKPLAYETERRAINADFEQVTESTLKLENRKQGLALYQATVNRNPVLTPEQKIESVQKWNERRDLSDAKGVLSSLEDQQDIKALQELHQNVDTVFPHMKVETRDAYKSNIESSIDRIEKGLAIKAKEKDKEIAQLSKDFVADAFTGYPISTSLVSSTLEAVKGTKYETDVREALALNKDAQAFRKASPIEQERSISRLTSELENTPQQDATLLQKKLNVFKGIAATSKQRANDDPVASVQSQTGHKLYTVTPEQIGTGQVDYKKAQITTQLLADQKKANGGVGSLIQWNKTERQAFLNRYHDATPAKQKAMLLDLANLSGGNKDAMQEYFTMLAGEQNAYDYMGIAKLAKMGIYLTGSNIKAADVALEGKHLINQRQDKLFAKQDAFNLQIQSEFGNAVGVGSVEHRAFQNMAYSIYVGLAKREGGIKTDEKGNPLIDKDLAKRSFMIATGGTYKQKLGKNTNTVFMPHGYTQSSFEDTVENHFRTQYRKETGFLPPENVLKNYVISPVPNHPRWYMFTDHNGKKMMNLKTRQAYVIRL